MRVLFLGVPPRSVIAFLLKSFVVNAFFPPFRSKSHNITWKHGARIHLQSHVHIMRTTLRRSRSARFYGSYSQRLRSLLAALWSFRSACDSTLFNGMPAIRFAGNFLASLAEVDGARSIVTLNCSTCSCKSFLPFVTDRFFSHNRARLFLAFFSALMLNSKCLLLNAVTRRARGVNLNYFD